MKIALVCPYHLQRPGGVRSHILGLGQALAQLGHQVEVIGPGDNGEIEGLPLIGCGRARRLAFGGTQIDLTWANWRQVDQVAARGYDIMHFHTIWNPCFPLQLASRFSGCKIATWHDAAGPNTPAWAGWLMPKASWLIAKLWLKGQIAVSALAASHLLPGSFKLIPNGIQVPALPAEGSRTHLLYLGRLEPRKGVSTLLQALQYLGSQAPPLWIAGEGPLKAQLQAQAASLPGVQFLGQVNEEQKWQLLRQARLLIAPSSGGESFGIILLEAMAAGTPPVAADNPGYHQVLKERWQQLLFPVEDAENLAQKIQHLYTCQSQWQQLQSWGLKTWQRYDWRVLSQQVEAVYLQALAHKTNNPANQS